MPAQVVSRFFEPSDWQAARIVAFDLTRHLNAGRVSAQMLAAVWSAMGDLLTTEAARRLVRMEIDRDPGAADAAEAAKVAKVAKVAVMMRTAVASAPS